jgi:2-octaprenyl-6-methoxyphenol hydroxylase
LEVADPGFTDVLIAGGGPVGTMLALGLRGCGVSVLNVRSETPAGERPIALSYGSRLLLEREGAWPAASPTPISEIHVSQQGGFGRTLLRAADYDLPALGYVAGYSGILAWLSAADTRHSGVDGKVIDWKPGADHIEVRVARTTGGETLERARLLVLADGGHAGLAENGHDYGQHAVVAEVQTERPHRNIAWERFTHGGPIALLPYQNRYALVWTIEADAARTLLAVPEAEFLLRLGAAFGRRLGAFLRAGPRASFSLSLRYRRLVPAPRTILVGNAAQTLHPVAGQGLNLGLRDAVELAELIASTHPLELGGDAFLKHYAARRRLDRGAGIRFTDALVRLFSNSSTTLGMVRGAGLAVLDILPPARGFLARRMIYGARALP